jgi:hypothetical protein
MESARMTRKLRMIERNLFEIQMIYPKWMIEFVAKVIARDPDELTARRRSLKGKRMEIVDLILRKGFTLDKCCEFLGGAHKSAVSINLREFCKKANLRAYERGHKERYYYPDGAWKPPTIDYLQRYARMFLKE